MSFLETAPSSPKFPPYFTCTLGHAQILNATLDPAPYSTINGFIDYLARQHGEAIAVACVRPGGGGEWTVEAVSFSEIKELSQTLSTQLAGQIRPGDAQHTIAFYASSSLSYVVHLLACFRSGSRAALISTACSTEAVRHLLKACNATATLFDAKHEQIIEEALAGESGSSTESILRVILKHESLQELRHLKAKPCSPIPEETNRPDNVILYGHSSGTSTGLPKPIPITFQDEIGALPRFHQAGNYSQANGTLSTTPIYTGGLADLWRSWSAGTALWTYPEHLAPITAGNLSKYIIAAEKWIQGHGNIVSPISYVSCVPYVTQMMAENESLMKWLQNMAMVGVGGAAMPGSLGDMLVASDINLVSRFGSRECGFLLSSDRDFNHDKEWQYVRHDSQVEAITFKPWNDADHELIVAENWPSLSPAIRNKLPFNSHDVFVHHPNIKNAWKYAGRSDVQITLRTGKKFDPAGIESALTASEWIKDAVVLGNDQITPSAIIFSSSQAEALDEPTRAERIWTAVSAVNDKCPFHARLKRNMIAILSSEESLQIQKSSKGTIMRGKFDSAFEDTIKSLCNERKHQSSGPALDTIDSLNRITAISSIVLEHLGIEKLEADFSFYDIGIDSTMSLQIRQQIQARLSEDLRDKVPLNIVYDTGSVKELSNFVGDLSKRLVNGHSPISLEKDVEEEIEQLLNRVYASKEDLERRLANATQTYTTSSSPRVDGKDIVLLTGATGFLGAHLLVELLAHTNVEEVICLVRKSSQNQPSSDPKNRIADAISSYGLSLSQTHWSRIRCLFSKLNEPGFDLEIADLQYIIGCTTQIVHAAWAVNFSLPLQSYASQLQAMLNLYKLSEMGNQIGNSPSFAFVSSTAAVLSASQPISEKFSPNPRDASSTGYGKSKWAAERLLQDLSTGAEQSKTTILRVGQLTASEKTGAWNRHEAWPLMLDAGFRFLGNDTVARLPDLSNISGKELDWLPVDLAAKSITEIVLDRSERAIGPEPEIFHILSNSESIPTWATVKDWLADPISISSVHTLHGFHVEFVPAMDWLDLLAATSHAEKKHLATSLIPLWRSGWAAGQSIGSGVRFSTEAASRASRTIELVASGKQIVTKESFIKMLLWVLTQEA